MTIAESIAEQFFDGETFRTEGGQHLTDLCRERQVSEAADPQRELRRHVFADGSAIVEGIGGWDVEGDTPFSWAVE